jgi:hypothetical protein
MSDEPATYKEAFIEHSHGFRWRFYSPDEGMLAIEYQEWQPDAKVWKTQGDSTPHLWTQYLPQILEAIKTVCS